MTEDEKKQLHEQATQLVYLAIRYADLSPMLSCDEWDGLAEKIGKRVVQSILERIDDERARIEQAKEVAYAES